MRKVLYVFLVALSFFFIACKKEKHSIRFVNNYSLAVTEVKADPLLFGDFAPGQASSYQSISNGNHIISGNCSTGYLQGSFSISGKGEHVWTLSLNVDKSITLIQEK